MIWTRIVSLFTVLFGLSCFSAEEAPEQKFGYSLEQDTFSSVVSSLKHDSVIGIVLIGINALQYSSADQARRDTSGPKSIIRFESENFALHTPVKEKIEPWYHWGSNLIARKVIRDLGDVVEVKSMDDELPEKLGHGGLGADYLYIVTTYLRKVDLVPVVAKTHKNEFSDGSFLVLGPGAAVGIPWNGDEKKRMVSVQHLHFETNVPDSLLALSYEAELETDIEKENSPMLPEKANIFLNGKILCPISEIRQKKLRTPDFLKKIDNIDFFLLSEPGIKLFVQSDSKVVDNYQPNIKSPVLTAAFEDPPRWYYRMEEGTPIYWPDGRQAGVVRQYYGSQSTTAPEDGRWCHIFREFLPNLKLCYKLEDIEVIDNGKE